MILAGQNKEIGATILLVPYSRRSRSSSSSVFASAIYHFCSSFCYCWVKKREGGKKKKGPEWIRTEPQKKGQRENGRLVGT